MNKKIPRGELKVDQRQVYLLLKSKGSHAHWLHLFILKLPVHKSLTVNSCVLHTWIPNLLADAKLPFSILTAFSEALKVGHRHQD